MNRLARSIVVFIAICVGALVGCQTPQDQAKQAEAEYMKQWATGRDARLDRFWEFCGETTADRITEELLVRNQEDERVEDLGEWLDALTDSSLVLMCPKRFMRHDWLRGESELENFGKKYMPHSYQRYEKSREMVGVQQEVFRDTYDLTEIRKLQRASHTEHDRKHPSPAIKTFTDSIRALVKSRVTSVRNHDELVHYYLLHKIGGITQTELLERDVSTNRIWLLEPMTYHVFRLPADEVFLSSQEKSFIEKYLPESKNCINALEEQYKFCRRQFNELKQDMVLLNYDRYDLSVVAYWEACLAIHIRLVPIKTEISDWMLKHKMMTLDSSGLAAKDKGLVGQLKLFEDRMRTYIKDRATGPILPRQPVLCPQGRIPEWTYEAMGFVRISFVDDYGCGLYDAFVREGRELNRDKGRDQLLIVDYAGDLIEDMDVKREWQQGDRIYVDVRGGVADLSALSLKFYDRPDLMYMLKLIARPMVMRNKNSLGPGRKSLLSHLTKRAFDIDRRFYDFQYHQEESEHTTKMWIDFCDISIPDQNERTK